MKRSQCFSLGLRNVTVAVAALSLTVTAPGCAMLQGLFGRSAGSLGVPTSIVSGMSGAVLPSSAMQSVASTTDALRSGNIRALSGVGLNLGVPGAVLLGRMAARSIQTAVERRSAERARKLQAEQQFYAGVCAQGAGGGKSTVAGAEADAEAAFAAGEYARAEKLLADAAKQHEASGSAGREALGRVQNKRAAVLLALSELQQAEPPAQQSIDVREKVLGKDHPDVAESAGTLASIYQARSDFAKSEPQLKRALSIREKALKEDHICVAQTVNQLANLYKEMAAYSRAEALYLRALGIRKEKLGEDSLEVAQTSADLGSLKQAMGNYGAAEPYYLRALEVRKSKLGADHPDVAETENELGGLYKLRGNYPQAESRYKTALDIREKKLPPSDPRIAESLSDLASLYEAMGDYKAAEPLLLKALDLRQKALGADHPEVAESMESLAQLQAAQGHFPEAEQQLTRALSIRETKLGKSHPAVGDSCSHLGDLQLAKGDLAAAERYYQRSLEVRKKAFGEEHPQVAQTLSKLGAVYRARGEFARAEPLFRQSLQLREKLLGSEHPEVAESLLGLAAAQLGLGKTDAAVPLLQRALTINEAVLRAVGSSANESRIDAFLHTLQQQEELTYSLLLEKSPSEAVVTLVATTALLRKGRSIDEAADTSRALYQGLGPDEQQKLASLREIKTRRADLALSGAGIYPPDVYQKLLKELQESEEKQQAELLQGSVQLRRRLSGTAPAQVLSAVQGAIPSDSALIEILAFRSYSLHPTAKAPGLGGGPVHYAALVLQHDGKPQAFDLGPGDTIDQTVSHLLAAMTDSSSDWEESAKALDQLVMSPLRGALKGKTHYYISADGQLSLVPFAVLPNSEGKGQLLDAVEISYVTSGRDLLRQAGGELHNNVALVADPQFSLASKSAAPAATEQNRATGVFRGLRLGKVAPLPGTRQEAKAIEKLLKKTEVSVLMGSEATKREFLKIEQPGILHVATHGLFLGETTKGGDTSRGLVLDDEPDARPMPAASTVVTRAPKPAFAENPLLSSMLVLAGAESASKLAVDARDPEVGNGLVTALEVASMNLWGTQLVILSACETGRGDVSNLGQGVYGLRRAVMVAGAQTLLTSLWKVDDKATRDLMTRYYKNLMGGTGRAESMRDAALFIRKKRPHPYFWAPFIAIGRSSAIEGIGKGKGKAAKAEDTEEETDDAAPAPTK